MESQKNIVEQNKLVIAIKANDPKVLQQLYQENYKKVEAILQNAKTFEKSK